MDDLSLFNILKDIRDKVDKNAISTATLAESYRNMKEQQRKSDSEIKDIVAHVDKNLSNISVVLKERILEFERRSDIKIKTINAEIKKLDNELKYNIEKVNSLEKYKLTFTSKLTVFMFILNAIAVSLIVILYDYFKFIFYNE